MQESLDLGNLPYSMPKYLSPSAVSTFNQCPMRYKFSKLDKIPEPSTDAQVIGSFVHEVLEFLFKEPSKDRTEARARSLAKELWESKWFEEYDKILHKPPMNEFRWKSWWCIENYFKVEDPTNMEANGLEEIVQGDINGVPIFGIIDRWHLTDNDKIVVSDYKTGKKPRKQYEWEKKMQIMIYVDLLEQITGYDAECAELLYLKSGDKVQYAPTDDLRESVHVTLKNTWEELSDSCGSGEFECRTGPLCNWCNFKEMCPAWRKS